MTDNSSEPTPRSFLYESPVCSVKERRLSTTEILNGFSPASTDAALEFIMVLPEPVAATLKTSDGVPASKAVTAKFCHSKRPSAA